MMLGKHCDGGGSWHLDAAYIIFAITCSLEVYSDSADEDEVNMDLVGFVGYLIFAKALNTITEVKKDDKEALLMREA